VGDFHDIEGETDQQRPGQHADDRRADLLGRAGRLCGDERGLDLGRYNVVRREHDGDRTVTLQEGSDVDEHHADHGARLVVVRSVAV
jgi:hypothetical protein